MAPFLLTEKDVEGLLRMDDALAAVEEGLGALGRGDVTNRPRQRVGTREATVNVMLASWPGRGYAGFKYYTTSRAGIRFWVHLVDIATGELVAVIQADRLGQQRTGAASGVATKYLARSDASTVGIVGTGSTAVQMVSALVGRVEKLSLFQRTAQWIMPQENPPYSPDEQSAFRTDPSLLRGLHSDLSKLFAEGFASGLIDANSPAGAMARKSFTPPNATASPARPPKAASSIPSVSS